MTKTVYVVTETRVEQLKTTSRSYGSTVDSVWTEETDAKERVRQIEAGSPFIREYQSYKTASYRKVFLDPANTSEGTAFAGTSRYERGKDGTQFQVLEYES